MEERPMNEQPTNVHLLQHVVLAADDVSESRSGMEQRAVLADSICPNCQFTLDPLEVALRICPLCLSTWADAGENS